MEAARILTKTKATKNPSKSKKTNFKAKNKVANQDIRKWIKVQRKGSSDTDGETGDEDESTWDLDKPVEETNGLNLPDNVTTTAAIMSVGIGVTRALKKAES